MSDFKVRSTIVNQLGYFFFSYFLPSIAIGKIVHKPSH